MRTERERSDRNACGLSDLGSYEDGVEIPEFTEIKIQDEAKFRGNCIMSVSSIPS